MKTDNHTNPNNETFDFEAVPKKYTLCYHAGCPLRENCMRFFAAVHAPETLEVRRCVLPQAEKDGHCRWHDPIEVLTMAEGFDGLFDRVLAKDAPRLRKDLTKLLRGPKQFYQYMHGERPLSPAQQQTIRQLIRDCGYDWDVPFEHYFTAYHFGNPPVDND